MIISIQSQVVHGKVGNSAAMPALQAHGLTVAAVPTTLLSNHPHYPTMRGRVLPCGMLAELLLGVEERGLTETASILITGYLGSAENGEIVAGFVERAKERNPKLIHICDPVCGDDDLGGFVETALQRVFTQRLLPLADVATPNLWEARALTNRENALDAARSVQAIGPAGVIITAGNCGTGELQTLVLDKGKAWRIRSPRLPVRPAGSGDLFTACLAAKLARGEQLTNAAGNAVAAVHAVLACTNQAPWSEMPVESCLAEIVMPSARFTCEPIDEDSPPATKRP